MALNRTQLEITVKTVGQQAIQALNKELGMTRAEAKRAIAEFTGFEKAKDTLDDFNEAVLDTEKGIQRYVKFLEKQRAELKFNGDEYKQLTAEILNYQNQVKQAQSAAVVTPLSAADLRTEQGINQHIQALQRQASTLDMASEAYVKLKAQIRDYQKVLKEANAEPAPAPEALNPRSLAGIRQSIQDLERLKDNVEAGSAQFYELGRQIEFAKRNLEQYVQAGAKSGVINGVAPVTEQGVKNEIDYLTQVRSQLRLNSEEYNRYTAEIRKYQKQIQEAQNPREYLPNDTLGGLRENIQAQQRVVDRMRFSDPGFEAAKQQLEEYNKLLRERTQLRLQPATAEELKTEEGLQKQIQYLQQQRKELNFLEKDWQDITREIDRLTKEFNEASAAALKIKPLPTSERGIRDQIEALQRQRAELDITSAQYAKLTLQIREYDRELQRAQEGAGTFGGRFGGRLLGAAGAVGATSLFGGGIVSGLGAGAGYLAGGQAGAFAAAGIAQSIQMTVLPATELAAQVSRLNRVLQEESGAEYGRNLDFVRKIAISTGQTLPEATQSFLKLNAAVKAAGGTSETARGVFEAISGAVVKFGGSAQEVNGALIATTQVFSKGKVSAEELSGQIGERLVGAYAKFAKANGYTTKELSKFLEEGEVTLDQFLKFAQFIQKDGVKALEEYATSTEGAGARFNAAFSQFQVKVGAALLPAGAALQDFGVKVLEVAGDGIVALVKAAEGIGKAFASIPKPVADAALAFVAFTTAFKALSVVFAAGQVAIPATVAGFTTLAGTVAALGGVLPTVTLAAKGFWAAVTGPIGAAALVVSALASIGAALYQNNQAFKDWVDSVVGIIRDDFGGAMRVMGEAVSGTVRWIGDTISGIGESINVNFGKAIDRILEKLGQLSKGLTDWFSGLPDWAKIGLRGGIGASPLGTVAGGIIAGVEINSRAQSATQRRQAVRSMLQPYTVGGITYDPLTGRPINPPAPFNNIQTRLPNQSNDDDGKKEKAKRDKALQDYYDKLLRLQREAFENQLAYDKQLFENRLRRAREEFDRRNELARLSEEARISGLTGGARQVADFFQKLNDRRRKDEADLFQLRQSYDQKLFDAEQRRLQDTFQKRQETIKEQVQAIAAPSTASASFDTFTAIARSAGLVVSSAHRPGDRGFHGTNQARDYAGTPDAMLKFAKTMAEQFGTQLKELIYTPLGFGIKNGQRVPLSFWGDRTNAGHHDHVHVAFTGGVSAAVGSSRARLAPRVPAVRNVGDDAALKAGAAMDLEAMNRLKVFQGQAGALAAQAGLNQLTSSIKETTRSLQEEAQALRERNRLVEEGYAPDEADRIVSQQQRINKAFEEGRAMLLEFDRQAMQDGVYTKEEIELRNQLATAIENQTNALVGLVQIQESDAARRKVEELRQAWAAIGTTIADGVGGAISAVAFATGDLADDLRNIATNLLRQIADQILQITIVKPLSNVLGNFIGGFFANGGIMTPDGPLPLQTYARGGIANSPQVAVFGEGSMNEAYVPLPDGRRIPVAMQGGAGGNTSVVVNVDAKGTDVQGSSPNAEALGRVISQAVQTEIVRQKRPGGLLFAGG